jgi:hypothetical protein
MYDRHTQKQAFLLLQSPVLCCTITSHRGPFIIQPTQKSNLQTDVHVTCCPCLLWPQMLQQCMLGVDHAWQYTAITLGTTGASTEYTHHHITMHGVLPHTPPSQTKRKPKSLPPFSLASKQISTPSLQAALSACTCRHKPLKQQQYTRPMFKTALQPPPQSFTSSACPGSVDATRYMQTTDADRAYQAEGQDGTHHMLLRPPQQPYYSGHHVNPSNRHVCLSGGAASKPQQACRAQTSCCNATQF